MLSLQTKITWAWCFQRQEETVGDTYIAHQSFSKKLSIKNCWGKGSLKRQHRHLPTRRRGEAALQRWGQMESPAGRRPQPIAATDDFSLMGPMQGGCNPQPGAPFLLSICEVKKLLQSSDVQGERCLGNWLVQGHIRGLSRTLLTGIWDRLSHCAY